MEAKLSRDLIILPSLCDVRLELSIPDVFAQFMDIASLHAEQLGDNGRSHRQVSRAAAAVDHHVDLVFISGHFVKFRHRHTRCGLHRCGIAAGEHRGKLHIRAVGHGGFHALAQITVTDNTDSDHTNTPCLYFHR